MSNGDRSDAPPIDKDLEDHIRQGLTAQRSRVLIVGGILKMYDQVLLDRSDFCIFRPVEKGKALRNFSVPKSAGCIVRCRNTGHRIGKQIEYVCPKDVTIIPGVYDTNVINRVLLRLLAERPVPQPEAETTPESQAPRKETSEMATPPEPQPHVSTDTNAVILLALYSEMPARDSGQAWISDKKTGKTIRGICGDDADTRSIVATFIRKEWLLPNKRANAARVGNYGATEAGINFLKTQGAGTLDLWCPMPPPPEAASSSGLAVKISDLEREIEAEAGLDEELVASEAKIAELKARIKDRDAKEERLKQIKALLE